MREAVSSLPLSLPPSLILITDSRRFPDEQYDAVIEAALEAGLPAILLREKELSSAQLLARASRLRTLTRQFNAKLIIHSQLDVAQAVDADGIHVASADIGGIQAIRHWLGDQAMSVSVSCHNSEELDVAAANGADFALLSPVFPTQSHPGAPALGEKLFHELAGTAALPVVALGGIDVGNASLINGCKRAVIGAIFAAEDPQAVTRRLIASAEND